MTEQNYSTEFQRIIDSLKQIRTFAMLAFAFAGAGYLRSFYENTREQTRLEDLQSRMIRIEQTQSNLVDKIGGGVE